MSNSNNSLNRSIKPLIVKAHIGGDHKSLCDSCHQRGLCKLYSPSKRVYFCRMPNNRTKKISKEDPHRRKT
jgi:hypothetical protein